MRGELSNYVCGADLRELQRIELVLTGRDRRLHVHDDLGSDLMEKILDEIENTGHDKLSRLYLSLKASGNLK
jgi:hypothetical protein